METQIKRRGNPSFGRKPEQPAKTEDEVAVDDFAKEYLFQLIKTHESAKPVDGKTGERTTSAYQPFFGVPNSGTAWDADYISPSEEKKAKAEGRQPKKGGRRRWRYIHNYPTIWVDEQIDPEPSKEEIRDEGNDLIFRNGLLRVFGHQEMKLQALQLYDGFEGNPRPLKNVPKDYKLLDQAKIDKQVIEDLDAAFDAEDAARGATLEEMYAVGYYFGIDPNMSDDAFRKAFRQAARTNPKIFLREFANPRNKYKYLFLKALADNLISTILFPGKVALVESNVALFDIKGEDAAEELATLTFTKFDKAVILKEKLEAIYKERGE